MKEIIIKLSKSTFFWNTFNWFVAVLTTEITWLWIELAPVILAWLSYVTKELNKKFNPYYY